MVLSRNYNTALKFQFFEGAIQLRRPKSRFYHQCKYNVCFPVCTNQRLASKIEVIVCDDMSCSCVRAVFGALMKDDEGEEEALRKLTLLKLPVQVIWGQHDQVGLCASRKMQQSRGRFGHWGRSSAGRKQIKWRTRVD